MRPTTSTTTNKKNRQQANHKFFEKTPFVSTPFRLIKNSIQQIFVARRFRGLTHSRYNFKWGRGRRVKFGYSEILVLEKTTSLLQICYREARKNWLIDCYLHHGYGWSRIYVKLWQVGPYSLLWTETEGRRIFLSETENDFTRRKLRNHETPRYW